MCHCRFGRPHRVATVRPRQIRCVQGRPQIRRNHDETSTGAANRRVRKADSGRHVKLVACTTDVVVPIDDVVEKKFATVDALESQIYECGCDGAAALVPDPKDAAAVTARKKAVREEWSREFSTAAEKFRAKLKEQMGAQNAAAGRYAE